MGKNFMGYNNASELITAIGNKIKAKYTKPNTGIPKSDLDTAVQNSLTNVNTLYMKNGETFNYVDVVDIYGGNSGTVYVSGDKVIVSGKAAWAKGIIKIHAPAGTYKVSCTVESSTASTLFIELRESSTQKAQYAFNSGTGNWSANATLSGGTQVIYITVNNTASALSDPVSATISNIKLQTIESYNAGFTEYVPHSSSNADLSKGLTETINSNAKNLWDFENPDASRDTTIVKNSDGSFTVSCTNATWTRYYKFITVIPGKRYTFSIDASSVNNADNFYVLCRTDDSKGYEYFSLTLANGENRRVFIPTTSTVWIAVYLNNSATSRSVSATIKPMICLNTSSSINDKYVPYELSNSVLTGELIDILDNGPKNLLSTPTLTASGNWVSMRSIYPLIEPGEYVFVAKATFGNTTQTNIGFKLYKSTTSASPLIDIPGILQEDKVVCPFTLSQTAGALTIWTQSSTVTFTECMICTKEAYAASRKYVPWAMNNAYITRMLNYDVVARRSVVNVNYDFNNIVTSGYYKFNGGPANTPRHADNDFGMLIVSAYDNYILQVCYKYTNGTSLYFRYSVDTGSTWSGWLGDSLARDIGNNIDMDTQLVGGVFVGSVSTNCPVTGYCFIEIVNSGNYDVKQTVQKLSEPSTYYIRHRRYQATSPYYSWTQWYKYGGTVVS